jgi:hypothetical protein
MAEPRLGAADALTTASIRWRFVDGRSGSEWGIMSRGSLITTTNGRFW